MTSINTTEYQAAEQSFPYFHRHWKAYSTLIGGLIYMIYLGNISITGNISPYIATYYDVTTTETSKLGLDMHILEAFFMPLGTWIIQLNYNPKLLILAGGLCGTGLMYLATYQTSYFLFRWMYCFSWAMASGLSFYAPMH